MVSIAHVRVFMLLFVMKMVVGVPERLLVCVLRLRFRRMLVVVMQAFVLWVMMVTMVVLLLDMPVSVDVFIAKKKHHPDEHQS